MLCPECREPVGPKTNTDTYKHALNCFHLPNEGVERLLAVYSAQDDERARRITALLQSVRKEG